MLRPDPRPPPSPSSEMTTTGRWWRSTSREATIPITPGCQPSPARTRPGASRSSSGSSRRAASAAASTSRSVARRSLLARFSSIGDLGRSLVVLGQEQLNPRIGPVEPPRSIDPRRRAGMPSRPRRAASARTSPPRAAPASPAGAPAAPPPAPASPTTGSHRPAAPRRRRSPEQPDRDRRQAEASGVGSPGTPSRTRAGGPCPRRLPQRTGQLPGHRRAAELLERIAVDRRMKDRAVGQLRARLMVVGDDHLHAQRAGKRDLLDSGDPAIDGDQQRGAALRELLDVGALRP